MSRNSLREDVTHPWEGQLKDVGIAKEREVMGLLTVFIMHMPLKYNIINPLFMRNGRELTKIGVLCCTIGYLLLFTPTACIIQM
jgi:hypothetical protein